MTEKFTDSSATRIIAALEQRAERKLKNGAQTQMTWGTVGAIDAASKTASAYIYGETDGAYMSEGFRVPEDMYLTIGQKVRVAMNYATGDRWVEEVLYPATAYKKIIVDLSSGKIGLGGGTSAPDHFIYRSTTGLRLDTGGASVTAGFSVEATAGQASVHNLRVAGDTVNRASLRGDTSFTGLTFGPGNAAADVNLYRRIAGTLSTDDPFEVLGVGAGTAPNSGSEWTYQYIDIRTASYPQGRIAAVQPTGRYADSADVVVYAAHANVLYERLRMHGTPQKSTFTGVVFIPQGVRTFVKAGAPVDTDFSDYSDGMLAVDTTNNRLYVRTGGGFWKYATLT